MRIINSGSTKFNVAVGRGLRAFTPWSWAPILVAVPLLLTAALWVMAPPSGQAQGTAPAQPTGLAAAPADQQAALTWDDPSDSSITGYEYFLRAQVAKLTASDGVANDSFARSVAVDGDTVVVGAWLDDSARGAAYVYTRQLGAWNQVAKLTDSDRVTSDRFGYSVAVDGDTVVIGAIGDDSNRGAAYVFTKPSNGWATTSTAAKLTASDGAGDDWFGYSVAVDGDTVVVSAQGDDSDQGSAYVFTKPANGWATTSTAAKLTASDGAGGDWFGYSVAVDGDTVVVSAQGDDSDQGSAYVFTKPANGWATTSTAAKLTASDGADDDRFGASVAVDGDTVVVGARGDDSDQGAAYVFTKPSNGWATTSTAVKLTASDGADDDRFGASVAMDGDTVVVGAPEDDPDQGAAYVFTKPSNGWATATETVKLTASDGAGGDWFGFSVAMDGDTVVAGALFDDDKGSDSGSAYVYQVSDWTDIPNSGSGDTNATSYTVTGLTNDVEYDFWIRATNSVGASPASDIVAVIVGPPPAQPTGLTATPGDAQATLSWDDPSRSSITGYEYLRTQASKLTASDGAASDDFGYSVAVDGDTAVVGAYGDDGDKGSAYVFTRESGAWGQVAKLTASDRESNDWFGLQDLFGISVAVDGDTVVVGAYRDDDNGRDSGSAYIFTKPSGGWANATETAKLTAFDGAAGDGFGRHLAMDGDTIVVGAQKDDDDGTDSGSAYLFSKPDTGWVTTNTAAKLTASDAAGADNFGVSIAVDGDTVVVGAWQDRVDGVSSGSAYVFTKPNGGWATATETAKLTASDGAFDDWFGASIAVDGDTVVVGAFWDDDGGTNSGSAYVFTKPNGGWATATETAKLTASNAHRLDSFGRSVAVDGDTVVVGASSGDGKVQNSGSAYLFTKPNSGWVNATETAELSAFDGAAYDSFGTSVALDGDTLVLGAHVDDDNGADSGSVYVYAASDWIGTPDWTAIPNSAAGETNATSYTVTDLTNDVTYSFRIRATNPTGTSPASDVVTVPWRPAPTNLVAGEDSTRVVLQWDTGDPGITHYLISSEITDGSGGAPPDKLVSAGSGTRKTADVTSLTNGTEYTFTVQAAAVFGDQIEVAGLGSSVNATPQVAVPATPTNLTATPGDGRVRITWDHPANITIRKYQYSTDGGTTIHHMNRSNKDTTSFTFKNLDNGTEYTLAIRASNLSGESAPAAVTATPVPVYVSNEDQSSGGLPAPDIGSAGQAQGFTTGGGAVGFHLGRVELDLDRAPGSGTLTVTIRRRNASGDPGDVVHTLYNPTNVGTGLQKFMAPAGAYLGKNTDYFVHMTYSGDGTEPRWKLANGSNEDSGAHSGWSVADTHSVASDGNWTDATSPLKIRVVGLNVPPPPPSAPENLTATPGDGQVSVTWDHPGNISIRKYQYSTDGGTTFNHMNRSNKDTTSFTFKNLTNGTEYQLAIRASNLSGESAPAVVTATPSD